MDLMTIGQLLAGFVMLIAGGELLVRGATSLAVIAGISPLVVGLTVVSLGTSAPELAVSVQAGLAGKADIAVGNVVGSNIFNVLFTLGLCGLITPLVVSVQIVRREVPVMIGVSLVFVLMALDGSIGFLDGLLLTIGIVSYTTWLVVGSRRETAAARAEYAREFGEEKALPARTAMGLFINLMLLIGGLAILIFGARLMVDSASSLARTLGVSDVIIGLTIVSIGTSLPEVVTSLIATLRGERDIATGNVIGSNIFNILGILGISSLVTPGGLQVSETIQQLDLPIMLAVALVCLPIFCARMRIERWKGALFLGYYAAYTTYLILDAMQHPSLGQFKWIMIYIAFPLTALILLVSLIRDFSRRPPSGAESADSADPKATPT